MDMDITGRDIAEFMDDKWRDSSCPRCGEVNWIGGAPNNFKGLLPLGDDSAASVSQAVQALPAFWLVCGNCGHVELIGAKVIRRWKAERRGREASAPAEAE